MGTNTGFTAAVKKLIDGIPEEVIFTAADVLAKDSENLTQGKPFPLKSIARALSWLVWAGRVEVVKSCGGFKALGSRFWPETPPDQAAGKLRDCLNPDRREKLSPDQVFMLLKIGRQAGVHTAMVFLARECGYTDPVPMDPEDERVRLEREFIEAAKSMQAMADRLTRLGLKVA